jgi:putative ABC transport system permease protein
MVLSLRRYTFRAMQQRPGRTILTMLSIVIGVTAAVAVGLGTATTRNAYKQMFAMVTGRATLEIDGKGGAAFEDTVLQQIDELPEIAAASPLLDRTAAMTVGEDRRLRVQILGIDPERDKRVRDYTIGAGRQVASGDELVLEKGFAEYLGLKVGGTVKITANNVRSKPFTIVGLFSSQSGAVMSQLSMAFMPLDTAQAYFNNRRMGVPKTAIDKVQIVTKNNAKVEDAQAKIAALLPENVQVHRPAASTQLMQETMLSTEQGLTLTTLFTLLMAAFIILNTFLMNVSERRRHLSIMRAIGAKKSEISFMLLYEAIFLGIAGTVIGMGCGVLLAFIGTNLVATAFDVQLPRLVEVMTIWPFVMGGTFGMGMALLGAIIPAIVAWFVSPLEGMNRVVPQMNWNFTRILLLVGGLLTIGSLALIYGSIQGAIPIKGATYCGVTLLIGLVMLDTVVLGPQAALVSKPLKLFGAVEARMALTQVLRNYMRSALTVAVLFIAGSAGVGMASSIIDCIHDVHDWFDQSIAGDFFVRAMMPDMATGTSADLPEGLGEELSKLEETKLLKLDAASFVEGKVPKGADPSDALNVIVIAREYDDPDPPAFDLVSGDRTQLRDQLRAGQVVIGSVLSQKMNLKKGDRLPLETKEGVKEIPICGVANEYMVGGLAVHMAREHAIQWLGVQGVDGYIIKAAEARALPEIRTQLEAVAKKYDVILLSRVDIKEKVNQFVQGTQWSLWLLLMMGFVVGAFGVVNTLTMNVLEQTRELGLLRIVAMTKRQVRRTILMQAMIIGGVGLPPGILLGVAVAYVINLAMMPSFGHPVAFNLHPDLLVGTLVGALVIVLLAAIIPARRATRINVVEALHYE